MIQSANISDNLQRELALFGTQTRFQDDCWEKEDQWRFISRELEDVVALGIHIFERLNLRHRQYCDDLASGKIEFQAEEDSRLGRPFESWFSASQSLIDVVGRFEYASELKVAGTDDLKAWMNKCPHVKSRMDRGRFVQLQQEHPSDAARYDEGEQSLAHFDQ